MKLLFPLIIFLAGCSNGYYGSLAESRDACKKWANNGFDIKWRAGYAKNGIKPINTFPSRECQYEKETRQFLGYSYHQAIKGKLYSSIQEVPKDWVVKKRFKF